MTCCRRGVMDQRLFGGTEFLWRRLGRSTGFRQAEQRSAGRQTGWAAEYQVGLQAWGSLAWRGRAEVEGGEPMRAISPQPLRLAKQIIRSLIVISRVIIYTKMAHSPKLRRQGLLLLLQSHQKHVFRYFARIREVQPTTIPLLKSSEITKTQSSYTNLQLPSSWVRSYASPWRGKETGGGEGFPCVPPLCWPFCSSLAAFAEGAIVGWRGAWRRYTSNGWCPMTPVSLSQSGRF